MINYSKSTDKINLEVLEVKDDKYLIKLSNLEVPLEVNEFYFQKLKHSCEVNCLVSDHLKTNRFGPKLVKQAKSFSASN